MIDFPTCCGKYSIRDIEEQADICADKVAGFSDPHGNKSMRNMVKKGNRH